ncbi:Thioredoxin [Marinobacter daqiaonensis]|uniref:Thioredoxin n=1 Tax=Marinobacter daqiaonensis TaxID=650891 RepID=A0A1I6HJM7_9GAMM|nr:thioredoxin family protein [Marinobacter daqiaonensis]SFR54616.1 Thioredoxin [Marinobacter daqiaonensis]
MKNITSEESLTELLQTEAAVLLFFGGRHCGVCQAVKPQLETLATGEFPGLVTAYIDCQETAGVLCACRGIFSLPVVQLWFEGQRFAEFVRVFSLGEIRGAVERPYRALFEAGRATAQE